MSILGQTGAKACRECGERARAERDRLEAENASLRGAAQGLGELCDKYKAENVKLRKRLAQYELFECVVGDPSTEFARLRRELHRLQRENAKLRDAVSYLYRFARTLGVDEDDMRELGIDVPDE